MTSKLNMMICLLIVSIGFVLGVNKINQLSILGITLKMVELESVVIHVVSMLSNTGYNINQSEGHRLTTRCLGIYIFYVDM